MVQKSRAEYFRKRRETRRHFSVLVDKEQIEALENKLQELGITKTQWFEEKLKETLSE